VVDELSSESPPELAAAMIKSKARGITIFLFFHQGNLLDGVNSKSSFLS
jgi:hypothetical protein